MPTSKEERDRILALVEAGQITAEQAAQLLDALATEERPPARTRNRILRIHATHTRTGQQNVDITASLPVRLLKISLDLGMHFIPQLEHGDLDTLLQAIENGAAGRLLDVQDLEQGERLEIFVE